MKRSARLAIVASVVWVIVVWFIWIMGDYYNGETQVAMLVGLAAIFSIKLIFGRFIDKSSS